MYAVFQLKKCKHCVSELQISHLLWVKYTFKTNAENIISICMALYYAMSFYVQMINLFSVHPLLKILIHRVSFCLFSPSMKWKFMVSLENKLRQVLFFLKLPYERMFLLKQTLERMFAEADTWEDTWCLERV